MPKLNRDQRTFRTMIREGAKTKVELPAITLFHVGAGQEGGSGSGNAGVSPGSGGGGAGGVAGGTVAGGAGANGIVVFEWTN
ncbi:MAG: hypothetical protein ACRD72_12920 [Candidatus Angelobacter sp.]|jgi:hypothetical protein